MRPLANNLKGRAVIMLRKSIKYLAISVMMGAIATVSAVAQKAIPDYQDDDYYLDKVKVDRYLDIEVWTNHADGDFYEGDNIVISFRANRDAFVVVYSIDTRGRVNMLFPASQHEDNWVRGGQVYRIPGGGDEYDLVVTGPEGAEQIQAIASRDRIPLPDWYPSSGVICDWDDRHDFMDYLNARHFVRYEGHRMAFDRSAIYINEWEPNYYRPVYYPTYPSWTVTGNVYIDYPWGSSIYVDGIYWGVTPLYIPWVYVGWHTFTIYDHYGYCWERNIHVTRYNTVLLDRTIVTTSSGTRSKYKEVRRAGYRNPVSNGYPNYGSTKKSIVGGMAAGTKLAVKGKSSSSKSSGATLAKKKYVRGTTEMVKTERGLETTGNASSYSWSKAKRSSYGGETRSGSESRLKGAVYQKKGSSDSRSSGYSNSSRKSSDQHKSSYQPGKSEAKSTKKSGYYIKKSGSKSSSGSRSSRATIKQKGSSSSKSSGKSRTVTRSKPKTSSGKSSGKAPSVKSAPKGKSSAPATKSSGSTKSSKSSKKSGGKKR